MSLWAALWEPDRELHGLTAWDGVNREQVSWAEVLAAADRAAALPSLVRELGDNYALYHAHVRSEAERAGGRPRRADFGSPAEFLEACGWAAEIVKAEMLLRACRSYRRDGRPLSSPIDPRVPLVDDRDQLVSVE